MCTGRIGVEVSSIKVSFVVCTYSKELFQDTLVCIDSLVKQDYADKEILLVMDENIELYNMFASSLPYSVKIIQSPNPGLSAARNLGIINASGDIIVFIDDDAKADTNYIQALLKNYDDRDVAGVTGKIFPMTKPNYPEELYWI